MLPYQERVIEERDALAAKTIALGVFLNNDTIGIATAERIRMTRQLAAMREYGLILNERIDNFTEVSK
jgi:hypothetical protein